MSAAATLYGTGAPGEIIDGRYLLGRPIGRGGMGIVREAHDVLLDRRVAVKLVDPALSHPDAVRLFQSEAQALARIRHLNVVPVYTLGEHEGVHFFVMEYVEGLDVDALIAAETARGRRMTLERTLDILRQVAGGLDAVHEHGLLHRDVKPSNIVVEAATGRAVLIDFGLARRTELCSRERSGLTGTPWYMAPEQASPSSPPASPRSDLYSLACTAFHMLTGRPVFDHDDPYRAAQAHAESPPPAPSSVAPELAALDAVFEAALAKAPTARHASCAAFVAALEHAAKAVAKAPQSRISRRRSFGLRVLMLGSPGGTDRRLEAVVRRTLTAPGDDVSLEVVESPAGLLAALADGPADIVLVDERAHAETDTEALLARVRHGERGERTELLVFARDLDDTSRLEALGAVVLPTPENLRVTETTLSKMALRLAQTRRPLGIQQPCSGRAREAS